MSTASLRSARTSIQRSRAWPGGAGQCSARREPSGLTGSSFRPFALVPIDAFRTPYGEELADLVADSEGILGGVTYRRCMT